MRIWMISAALATATLLLAVVASTSVAEARGGRGSHGGGHSSGRAVHPSGHGAGGSSSGAPMRGLFCGLLALGAGVYFVTKMSQPPRNGQQLIEDANRAAAGKRQHSPEVAAIIAKVQLERAGMANWQIAQRKWIAERDKNQIE